MRTKHMGDNSELSKLYRKFLSVFTKRGDGSARGNFMLHGGIVKGFG